MSKTITHNMPEILERLSAFFPANEVKSFPLTVMANNEKGMAAFYIDNRAVQQRLDETCVWKNRYVEDPRSQKSILCGLSILVETGRDNNNIPILEWIERWDGADNTDIEATKGGLSGSMRRAAVQWGIGRYLYDVPGMWVAMKPPANGKKAKYFKNEPRIPAQFLPAGTASRAQKAAADKPAPASTAKKSTTKAKATGNKLTAAQTKKFKEATEGIPTAKVKEIYAAFVTGKTDYKGMMELVVAAKVE